MMPAAIEFDHVSHQFGTQRVLSDVSFRFEPGETAGVIGANGGGKTTLLRIALGLLQPQKGTVRVFGERPETGCRRIGYVPQSIRFDPLFPVTSLDIVLMGRLDRVKVGFFKKSCREFARQCLAEVGLEKVAATPFAKLSGGQRQRVLIARALACEPDFLLLDEPTANIDLAVEAQFIETLHSLKDRLGILMVTHDIGLLQHLGDRVLCVNKTVHWHEVDDLQGDLLREVYSGEMRHEHDIAARHEQGDHTKCDHTH